MKGNPIKGKKSEMKITRKGQKRYRMEPYSDPSHTGVNVQALEDPDGEWSKWEDMLGLQSHDGYIRTKSVATDMAVSLHQRFDINAATLRFKIKDCQPFIIDVDMDAFEKFMRTNSADSQPECNCEYESKRREGFVSGCLKSWICPVHGFKSW